MAAAGALAAAAAVASIAAGCGTAAPELAFLPIPDRETTAVLAGPLCEGKPSCVCQSAPGEAGRPADTLDKRYELKLGPVDNELWAMVDGKVLYKTNERAAECFYLDLRAGRHTVVLRATGDSGFGARLHVSELGAKGAYDTFDFQCGGPGLCDLAQLRDWEASLAKYERNVHDPCGSTKIRDIRWQSGKAADRLHPTEIQLQFELEIYEFDPKHPPGHPACKDRY